MTRPVGTGALGGYAAGSVAQRAPAAEFKASVHRSYCLAAVAIARSSFWLRALATATSSATTVASSWRSAAIRAPTGSVGVVRSTGRIRFFLLRHSRVFNANWTAFQ